MRSLSLGLSWALEEAPPVGEICSWREHPAVTEWLPSCWWCHGGWKSSLRAPGGVFLEGGLGAADHRALQEPGTIGTC